MKSLSSEIQGFKLLQTWLQFLRVSWYCRKLWTNTANTATIVVAYTSKILTLQVKTMFKIETDIKQLIMWSVGNNKGPSVGEGETQLSHHFIDTRWNILGCNMPTLRGRNFMWHKWPTHEGLHYWVCDTCTLVGTFFFLSYDILILYSL